MLTYDVVIIGSGMAGSMTALLLSKLGYKTLMVEKDEHPRFALGESSTPVVSKKMYTLAKIYDIPELIDLSSYDRIMASKEPFLCGPKELFQYFIHAPDQKQAKLNGEYPEIIVQTPEVDTQFMRSEVDMRIVKYAQQYGSAYIDHTEMLDADFRDDGVTVHLQKKGGEPYKIETKFLVDGTGFRSLLSKKFNLRIPDNELDTPLRSRCIFTHFKTVGRLEDAVEHDETFNKRTTVDRVRATQHHCFDGGWYWFIPFDNGVTSVGINLDMDKYPMNDLPAEEEFWQLTNRLPIVKAMLQDRETLMPYIKTGRLQFRTRQAVGDRWALLPAAATGADAWFSTGLGLTLVALHRLVEMLHTRVLPKGEFQRAHLEHYENCLFKEWRRITKMVDSMYKSFKHWDIFKSTCYFFFMGVESFVYSGGHKRPNDPSALMLSAGNAEFVGRFEEAYAKVLECNKKDKVSAEDAEFLQSFLQNEMRPFNHRDYGNPMHGGVHYRLDESSVFYRSH